MRVVVDTNVLVSALILPESVPGRVLRLARDGRIELVCSWTLAEELADVLRRPKLRRYEIDEEDVRDLLLLLAPFLPDVEIAVRVRDPDDTPVVAAAVAGRAEAIITGDAHLLADAELRGWLAARGVDVLTPAELYASI